MLTLETPSREFATFVWLTASGSTLALSARVKIKGSRYLHNRGPVPHSIVMQMKKSVLCRGCGRANTNGIIRSSPCLPLFYSLSLSSLSVSHTHTHTVCEREREREERERAREREREREERWGERENGFLKYSIWHALKLHLPHWKGLWPLYQ